MERRVSRDQIYGAIRTGIDRFEADRPDVTLDLKVRDALLNYVDVPYVQNSTNPNDVGDIANRTYEFLERAADRQTEIAERTGRRSISAGEGEESPRTQVFIGVAELDDARKALWCGIYPFCKSE